MIAFYLNVRPKLEWINRHSMIFYFYTELVVFTSGWRKCLSHGDAPCPLQGDFVIIKIITIKTISIVTPIRLSLVFAVIQLLSWLFCICHHWHSQNIIALCTVQCSGLAGKHQCSCNGRSSRQPCRAWLLL